ncbi:uncharacterized protein BYT42DRAFT_478814, partial [Radiomyces spectabilis]|uniref:uncharacterized protein n=1 Tax=Radiomyces spectabilis TaxID=64574 RepID=UPI00221F6553
ALYGWQGYCIQDQGNTQCRTDSNVMTIPFADVWVTDQLNKTRPQLFEDAVQQDEDLNPLAKPNPPHDPKIYAGAILCLLCGGAAFVLAIVRTTFYQYFQDDYYARGLLASGATTLALLLLAQSSIMYQNAVQQLNVEYPHLEATEGPCMTVIGVAFTSYFIASCIFMHGFL